MNILLSLLLLLLAAGGGCTSVRDDHREPPYSPTVDRRTVLRGLSLDGDLEDKILALEPERIGEDAVRTILAAGPASRIVNLHGGIYPVHLAMESFSEFLIAMGYPEGKIRHPRDGRYSHSPYESSRRLAGLIAWHYEKDGMRVILVGHSQGGIQVIKVLHELAGAFDDRIPVWNPLTDASEERTVITDPLTGLERPVVGLQVAYATVVGAGGAALLLPNQWSMVGRLRNIPDTVEEFTGFTIDVDFFAWDFLGLGPAGQYQANGIARIRNVTLPAGYGHVTVPATSHLATHPKVRDWINAYAPGQPINLSAVSDLPHQNILWAADVWHSIKKHWCLELQRLIRAKRALRSPP